MTSQNKLKYLQSKHSMNYKNKIYSKLFENLTHQINYEYISALLDISHTKLISYTY